MHEFYHFQVWNQFLRTSFPHLSQKSTPYMVELKQWVQFAERRCWWFPSSFWLNVGEEQVCGKCPGEKPRINVSSRSQHSGDGGHPSTRHRQPGDGAQPGNHVWLRLGQEPRGGHPFPLESPGFRLWKWIQSWGLFGAWENMEPTCLKFNFNGCKSIL